MLNQLYKIDIGGVEPVIALAIKNKDTQALGLCFENLLLEKVAKDLRRGDELSIITYMRYALYRGSAANSVETKMQKLLDNADLTRLTREIEEQAIHFPNDLAYSLEHYFTLISGERQV